MQNQNKTFQTEHLCQQYVAQDSGYGQPKLESQLGNERSKQPVVGIAKPFGQTGLTSADINKMSRLQFGHASKFGPFCWLCQMQLCGRSEDGRVRLTSTCVCIQFFFGVVMMTIKYFQASCLVGE